MIVKKNFPYEILLRFSEGAAHQTAKAGDFEGAHYIEHPRLVDEVGNVVGVPQDDGGSKAVPISKVMLAEFFGKKLANFMDGQAALRDARDAALAEVERLKTELETSAAATVAALAEIKRLSVNTAPTADIG